MDRKSGAQSEDVSLERSAQNLLDECRMVLPGIQALFGFQLVAVFSQNFSGALSAGEQRLHLVAIGLIAVAIALIMTPAAYHRQTGPREVTSAFIDLSSRLLLLSMLPLAAGVCLDFYLIAAVILGRGAGVGVLAAALFLVFAGLWFGLPHLGRRRKRRAVSRA
jgi:hypothetical protein